MTDLFRFVALRAAGREPLGSVVDLSAESELQRLLATIHTHSDGHDATNLQVAQRIVGRYLTGDLGPGFLGVHATVFDEEMFDRFAAAAAGAGDLGALAEAVHQSFGRTASDLVDDEGFTRLRRDVRDTIVAVVVHPTVRSRAVADLALLARLTDLIARVADEDETLDEAGGVQAALTAILVLPTRIFPLRTDLPQPVGVGDLLVVKQQLKRYDPGDIATIENILRGETREKIDEHDLITDRTTVTESSTTTETTTSLDVTERFELKTEVANVVKEDLAVNAGVNVSAKYGAVEINANANVAYKLSKEESTKVATNRGKDVTSRAATRVTETVRRQEIARTIEKQKVRETHTFNNAGGGENISGVYQWLNKVYEAQVFNYGKRLLFDLTVPEPAGFVRDVVSAHATGRRLVPPEPLVLVRFGVGFPMWRPVGPGDLGPDGLVKAGLVTRPLRPSDLSTDATADTYYGIFMAKFGVVGVNAPPEPITTVSKGITGSKDDHDHLTAVDDLTIPQGYQADHIAVRGAFTLYENEDGDEEMVVYVGTSRFEARGLGDLRPAIAEVRTADGVVNEQGSIPIAVTAQQARDFAITVDVTCKRTDAAVEQWRLDTYAAVLNARADLAGRYEDAVKAQAIQDTTAPALGDNPAQNRILERTELKKGCIALLSGTDLYTAAIGDVARNDPPPAFPRPQVPPRANPNLPGGDQEAFIRFFEQAFEWEHMTYLFYPYYWARRDTWYGSAITDNPDPLFAEFLKAGAARAVVPVRPQMEGDVRYFLMTGQIWGGGAMPEITDTDYLPITEEIRDATGAPGSETPQGEPWEITLPTALIRLRADVTLPEWRKFPVDGRDRWVPGRIVDHTWTPDEGHLDADGDWTPDGV